MNTEVTLVLPDYIYQRARRLAELTGKNVTEVLSQTLIHSLPPLASEMDTEPIDTLPNKEILSLADSVMDENLNTRMSILLDRQQAGKLTQDEHAELQMLMDIYNTGQRRKTEALVEAIKRGMRPSG